MDVNIEAVLIAHLRENYLPRGEIDPNEDLFDSGILDSAAVLSVVVFIESEFALIIPDEDLLPENFSCVASTVRYISARLTS
jgi:acyl carrier protein